MKVLWARNKGILAQIRRYAQQVQRRKARLGTEIRRDRTVVNFRMNHSMWANLKRPSLRKDRHDRCGRLPRLLQE